jgi:hypothetical protein
MSTLIVLLLLYNYVISVLQGKIYPVACSFFHINCTPKPAYSQKFVQCSILALELTRQVELQLCCEMIEPFHLRQLQTVWYVHYFGRFDLNHCIEISSKNLHLRFIHLSQIGYMTEQFSEEV